MIFAKTVLDAMKASLNPSLFRKGSLPAIFDDKTLTPFAKPFFAAISTSKAPSQILHAL